MEEEQGKREGKRQTNKKGKIQSALLNRSINPGSLWVYVGREELNQTPESNEDGDNVGEVESRLNQTLLCDRFIQSEHSLFSYFEASSL
jgi:hypothetical protein